MKRNRSKKQKSRKPFQHFPLLIVGGVIAVVALGAVTVISRQKAAAPVAGAPAERMAVSKQHPNYLTVKVAGREVQVDPQTGLIKPLSPQEAQRLAEQLKGMFNKSTDGLVAVHERDGSVSMDLEGRFQNVTVARMNEDGTVTQSCVDNAESAAKFFGLDPKQLGVLSPATQPAKSGQKNPVQ